MSPRLLDPGPLITCLPSQHCTESQTWCFWYWNNVTWLDILKAIINVDLLKLKTDSAYVQQLLLVWLWDSQFPQPTCSWKWVGTLNPLRAPNLTLKPFFSPKMHFDRWVGRIIRIIHAWITSVNWRKKNKFLFYIDATIVAFLLFSHMGQYNPPNSDSFQ